jgi:integrase
MARPNKVWYRADVGWWMVTIHGKKERLIQGPEDEHHRMLAEEKFCEIRKLRRESPLSPSARVADIIEAFLVWSSRHFAADTHYGYRFYGQLFAEKWGLLSVTDLKPYHVTQWADSNDWGETTEYNARRSVFRAFSWAAEEGILPKNPLKGMKRPRPRPRQRALTDDEYRALLRATDLPFRRFLFVLRCTGARPKELRTLRWEQLRDDRIVLRQHKTASKTRKPRIIYLPRPVQELFKRMRAESTSEHVFLNRRGRPWTKYAVSLRIRRLKEKLKLARDVCLYLTRHAFGTAAIVNGVDVATVAELMGHTSLDMISSVYCHLADQHQYLHEAATRASHSPRPSAAGRDPAG